MVRERQPCVVLTGAGISTESGIPDFRSPSGSGRSTTRWNTRRSPPSRRDPAKVWEFYALRFELLTTPSRTRVTSHSRSFERRGLVEAVVTQNVDGLHGRAGSEAVVEVHGSIRSPAASSAGGVLLEDVIAALRDAPAPPCPRCGAVLKPDVVMFGELLPAAAIDHAVALAQRAGLLLVVGSSPEVHPVAGLPAETVSAGGALAIVNRGRRRSTTWPRSGSTAVRARRSGPCSNGFRPRRA